MFKMGINVSAVSGVDITSPDSSITVGGTAQAPTLAVAGQTTTKVMTQQAFNAFPASIIGWGDGLTYNLANFHTSTGLQNFITDASEAAQHGLINDVSSFGTKAFSIDSSGTVGDYSTNTGVTWANMTTVPANITAVKDIDIRGDNAICVGTTGATPGAWYSTNAGKDWTQTASAVGINCIACCMFDANYGFLIPTTTKRVWTTANGGNTWADTGFAFDTGRIAGTVPRMYAVANNCVMLVDEFGAMGFMYTATGVVYYLSNKRCSTAFGVTNILKIGNYYCWVVGGYGTPGTAYLYRWAGVASNELEVRDLPYAPQLTNTALPYIRKIAYASSNSIAMMIGGNGVCCVGLVYF